MALVTYSDDSDMDDDSDSQSDVGTGGKNIGGLSSVGIPQSVANISYDESREHNTSKSSFLLNIPAARPLDYEEPALIPGADELDDVPTVSTWKVIQDVSQQKSDNHNKKKVSSVRKKVKFFVPSLAELGDASEDEDCIENGPKKLKPSAAGTGLLCLLPEPRHVSCKETKRSLVPHILSKNTKKPISSPYPKSPKQQNSNQEIIPGMTDSDSDDDGGTKSNAVDFFSLAEPGDVCPVSGTTSIVPSDAGYVIPTVINAITPQTTEQLYYPMVDDNTGNNSTSGNLDEQAMLRLMGKRRGADTISFIDVSADDALLSRDEWMTKALSEEKPSYSFSKKTEGLPTKVEKRKHQITFLAQQAKERELELKNTWAQNRQTKSQTQAKYGF